ncbi:MAG: signal peptidase I [candidate division Zixibacteria bacterium]|nr:signal peptidase I [candidate division Zixibacteria bacterium]MDD5426401.1 signal peptidase I [candidate division Zixibacteria bacterium]
MAFVDTVWDNVKQVFVAVVLALIIKTSIVEAYKIPTSSMEDTLLVGDFLLANKFIYGARIPLTNWRLPAIREPERGDVIIFTFPGDGVTKYIKRCIGLPRDTIEIKDKVLYINHEPFPLPEFAKYVDTSLSGQQNIKPRGFGGMNSRDNFGPYVVPPDSYFMMGDNRDNSYDSRFWNSVPKDLVLGEALLIHWSWDDEQYQSPEVTVSDPLSVPRLFIYNMVHFAQKVRWTRLFNLIS